jgi:hypothetical protein
MPNPWVSTVASRDIGFSEWADELESEVSFLFAIGAGAANIVLWPKATPIYPFLSTAAARD